MVFLLPNFPKLPFSNKTISKYHKIWTRDMILSKSEDKVVGFWGFWWWWVFSPSMLWALYSQVILVHSVISSWYHLKTYTSWPVSCVQHSSPSKSESRSETIKLDRIQEVWTRAGRKWSIGTYGRAEEKPKIKYWSVDSWPNFLRELQELSHVFP